MSMSGKKVVALVGLSAVLAACGPSQNAPQDQGQQQQQAASPPAAAPAPPPQAAGPTQDEQIAKLREEQRRLERRQKQLDQEAAARQASASQAQAPPACADCGVVVSVTPVRKEGQAGWAGTLGGAAAGGLAGNQFGKGKGNIAMTALGVVGGAFAGREVEKQVTADTVYQVTVNMENGSQRTVTVANGQGLASGTKVHVDGNSLLPY
jgi:outer membrane lipoprotein SlyB